MFKRLEKQWEDEMTQLQQQNEADLKWYDQKLKWDNMDQLSSEEKFNALKLRYAIRTGLKNRIILKGR